MADVERIDRREHGVLPRSSTLRVRARPDEAGQAPKNRDLRRDSHRIGQPQAMQHGPKRHLAIMRTLREGGYRALE